MIESHNERNNESKVIFDVPADKRYKENKNKIESVNEDSHNNVNFH